MLHILVNVVFYLLRSRKLIAKSLKKAGVTYFYFIIRCAAYLESLDCGFDNLYIGSYAVNPDKLYAAL